MTLAPTERRAERVEAEDLLTAYLTAQKARKNLSDYTLRNYANDLRQFFDYVDEEGWATGLFPCDLERVPWKTR